MNSFNNKATVQPITLKGLVYSYLFDAPHPHCVIVIVLHFTGSLLRTQCSGPEPVEIHFCDLIIALIYFVVSCGNIFMKDKVKKGSVVGVPIIGVDYPLKSPDMKLNMLLCFQCQ